MPLNSRQFRISAALNVAFDYLSHRKLHCRDTLSPPLTRGISLARFLRRAKLRDFISLACVTDSPETNYRVGGIVLVVGTTYASSELN
jgi:hypothetical protein